MKPSRLIEIKGMALPSVSLELLGAYEQLGIEAEANAKLLAATYDLYAACVEFVRKVEAGEARSTRSYAAMKAAIAKAKGEADERLQGTLQRNVSSTDARG